MGLALRAVVLTLVLVSIEALGQEIEPRAYANAPVGVNFLIGGYAYTRGGVAFDRSVPLTNPELTKSSAVLAYARALDFWGKSAKFSVVVPLSSMHGTAEYAGAPVQRDVSGSSDPWFKLSVNLYGAPALSVKEFGDYKQDLIIGVSLRVSPPMGQYDDTKVVNLGANRWSFKPEVGISKALGPWTLEAAAGVTLFTDNKDFFQGNTLSQDPLYALQGSAIYNFSSGIWVSLDATYFNGGRTTLNGTRNNDLQQNWRFGATLAIPVDTHNSIKLYVSSGVSARTGNDFDLVGIAWQYRWGGGL